MTINLENSQISVTLDAKTGGLLALTNKRTGWQMISQPKLAEGFRLLVPFNELRNNRISANDQVPANVSEVSSDEYYFHWPKVVGNKSGQLNISVTMKVKLEESHVAFTLALNNKTGLVIEEAWCPYLGGISARDGEPDLESCCLHLCGGMTRTPLGDGFPMECGYWGTDYPTYIRAFPSPGTQTSFELLSNEEQGVYLGVHDSELNIVNFVHELKPGYTDSKHHRVPREVELNGIPAGVCVSVIRMPYIQAGESMQLAPVVISPFEGTWHQGMEPYIQWREAWRKPRPQSDWVDEVQCWQTIHLDSPEGCIRYRYIDLPGIAREAKEQGVGALQVIGWAWDGQDGAEPYQDVNPRLGTHEELKTAIKEIEKMGVRVLLMCKFKWADRSTTLYKKELKDLALKDPYGNNVYFDGYGYQSLSQMLAGGTRRTGDGMCHLSDEYRCIARRELRKILELGPSGLLYDELSNHMLLCFAPNHGHKPGESNFKGSLSLAEEFYLEAKAFNPDFLLAGEGPNDYLSQYYPINYMRSWDGCNAGEPIHRAAWKYMDPEMKFATCLSGWDDKEMVNQCLVLGYIINFEPYHFKGSVKDYPETVAYAQKALQLRKNLWDYLWKGIYRDTQGAQVNILNGNSELFWSVFKHRKTGKQAIVIANQGSEEAIHVEALLDNGNPIKELYTIDGDCVQHEIKELTIPPRGLVVLIEG